MPERGIAKEPRAYLAEGEWPSGQLVGDAPPEARLAAGLARRLKEAVGERSLRSVARDSGLSVGTVANVVAGRSWGDLVTVARLERALDVELWGREHCNAHTTGSSKRNVPTRRSDTQSGRSDLNRGESGSPRES